MMEVTGSNEPGYGQIVAPLNIVLNLSAAHKGEIYGPATEWTLH